MSTEDRRELIDELEKLEAYVKKDTEAMNYIRKRTKHLQQELYAYIMPSYCPECGSEELIYDVALWRTQSLDDVGNTCDIYEHQCQQCGRAFWM